MRLRPNVQREEDIYSFTPAENGAGPLWCHGSTIVARRGDRVFAAGLETLPDQKPLNNCRWVLFRRSDRGQEWELVHRDATGRTREPSPLVLLGQGALLVSANPTLTDPDASRGPARPTVFRFDADRPSVPPVVELPVWRDEPEFTEHSYRTVTADRDADEVLYMQNIGYDVSHLSFRNRRGEWQGLGTLAWPRTSDYGGERQPLRLCYPNVILRNRAVHFFGVGDIVEPVPEWRQAKFEITQRAWDYVFRRLFYAYTPDIVSQPFRPWIEVANRDATAGAMRNGDVYLDDQGTAHLIWCETTVDERIRDRFFPGEPIVHSLEYMALRDGVTVARRTLARAGEDQDVPRPQLGRFHVLGDGTVVVVATFGPNTRSSTLPPVAYRAALLDEEETDWVDVPLTHPLPGTFLTNTVRGGSAPSDTLDLVGTRPASRPTLSYARVRLV